MRRWECCEVAVDCRGSVGLIRKGLVSYFLEFTIVCRVTLGHVDELVGEHVVARFAQEVDSSVALVYDFLLHFLFSRDNEFVPLFYVS